MPPLGLGGGLGSLGLGGSSGVGGNLGSLGLQGGGEGGLGLGTQGLTLPTLSPPSRVNAPILGAGNTQPSNLDRIRNLSMGQQILDQVRNRQISWQQANASLSAMPQDVRNELLRRLMVTPGSGPDEMRALSGSGKSTSLGGILTSPLRDAGADLKFAGGLAGNLVMDTASTVRTAVAGLPALAGMIGHDEWNSIRNSSGLGIANSVLNPIALLTAPIEGETGRATAKGFAQSEKQNYGQLIGGAIHGNLGEFERGLQQTYNHPLQPLLDMLSVASGGIGTAGRVGEFLDASNFVKKATAVTDVGNEAHIGIDAGNFLKVQPSAGGMWAIRDASGNAIANRFFTREEAIQHAQSVRTGGVDPDVLQEEIRKMYLPARGEKGQAKIFGEGANLTTEFHEGGIGSDLAGQLANEVDTWPSRLTRKGAFDEQNLASGTITGPGQMARDALAMAHETSGFGDNLVTVRNPDGSLAAVGSYQVRPDASNYLQSLGVPNSPMVEVGYLGAKTPGAGIQALGQLARKYPGHGFEFAAANDEVASYYESMGATRLGQHEFVILPDNAAKIARGEPIAQGAEREVKGTVSTAKPPPSPMRAGLSAAVRSGPKGSLIDAWENARGITHDQENAQIASEILDSLTDPHAPMEKAPIKERAQQTFGQVLANLKATRDQDVTAMQRLAESQPGFFSTPASALPVKALTATLRETIDFVRAGAIFLRTAYLPNNWAGNFFLNAIHQGVLAPINLAKSMALERHMSLDEVRALDRSVGFNSMAPFLGARGAGYVSSVTDPIAHLMGKIGDQPFRRAAVLHELRRKGYSTLGDVKDLMGRIKAGDDTALNDLADAGRRAQEEIIKFGGYNDIEKTIARNLIFVYSWMKGAGRYGVRFPFQHPIQAAVYGHLGQMGQDYLDKHMGGVPAFLIGAIPVGRAKDGNPLLINPFTVNPLGTGVELAQAAAGTVAAAKGGTNFNKYVQEDIVGLTNPLVKSYIESREGGRSVKESLIGSVAAFRLMQNLQHPGRGGIYPTSRAEALGNFFVGSLYPREADQAAITRSLERENINNPAALIPQQVSDFEKATGEKVPKSFITAYTADLYALQQEKDFKHTYATDHGKQGFASMPARNQAEAAIEYLSTHNLVAPNDLKQMKQTLDEVQTDQDMNAFANELWRMTGAGGIKRAWDAMMKQGKAQQPPQKEIP